MSEFGEITTCEHHGWTMNVRERLAGKHRDACLCYCCDKFRPDDESNCSVAQAVYKNCVEFGVVTPVWECSKFITRLAR